MGEPTRDSAPDTSVMQIDEPRYLGNRLDGRTRLVDADGRAFALADLLGKPVILLLSYYGCDGTCPTMNLELARVIGQMQRFKLGTDYRVLTVSFDARDSQATAAKFQQTTSAALPAATRDGWRHAVLADGKVDAFASSVGFKYFWSTPAKAFMHSNVLVFLTPEGRVARYIYGTRMDARTVELALTDADWARISNSSAVFDMLTGACFSYNIAQGRYQPNYSLLAGVGSFILGLGLLVTGAWVYRKRIGTRHG